MAKKHKKKFNWLDIARHLSKPVQVKFDDHAMNGEPIVCVVVGFLAKITKKYIMLVGWDTPNLETNERLSNIEYFCILKSTLHDIKPLRVSKKWG